MNATERFALHLERSQLGYIVYLSGQLDLAATESFKMELEPLALEANKSLTLNLKALQYIDSTGIGMLVYFLKLRNSLKAPFHVTDVPQKIQRLFDITGISKFLSSSEQLANGKDPKS